MFLKAGISEAEPTSIASQYLDNTHIRGKNKNRIAIARQQIHNKRYRGNQQSREVNCYATVL
jgi:hypothetical protein